MNASSQTLSAVRAQSTIDRQARASRTNGCIILQQAAFGTTASKDLSTTAVELYDRGPRCHLCTKHFMCGFSTHPSTAYLTVPLRQNETSMVMVLTSLRIPPPPPNVTAVRYDKTSKQLTLLNLLLWLRTALTLNIGGAVHYKHDTINYRRGAKAAQYDPFTAPSTAPQPKYPNGVFFRHGVPRAIILKRIAYRFLNRFIKCD